MIQIERKTKETQIDMKMGGKDELETQIDTGLPFLDHMLEQLTTHSGIQISVKVVADLEVDDHHCIEDVALTLGECLNQYWRSNSPNQRYGQRLLPMDECLTMCAIDLSGRPYSVVELPFTIDKLGGINTEMWEHFFYSLAIKSEVTLHIKNIYFKNNHHLIESAFKALAYALKEALTQSTELKTSKGIL